MNRSTKRQFSTLLKFALFGMTCCWNLALADLMVTVDDVSYTPSTFATQVTSRIFLDLTGSDADGSINVGNYGMNLELTGPNAGLDVMIAAVHNTSGQTMDLGFSKVETPVTATTTTSNLGASFVVGDTNANNGLMEVVLDIQPNVVGTYTLSITKQFMSTDPGAPYTLSIPVSGTISAVPEPSAFALVGLLALGVYVRQKFGTTSRLGRPG